MRRVAVEGARVTPLICRSGSGTSKSRTCAASSDCGALRCRSLSAWNCRLAVSLCPFSYPATKDFCCAALLPACSASLDEHSASGSERGRERIAFAERVAEQRAARRADGIADDPGGTDPRAAAEQRAGEEGYEEEWS